jgi:rod shape determining protein RodA
MFDRRLLLHFDWGLLLTGLALAAAGALTLRSAVAAGGAGLEEGLFIKQIVWMGGGLIAALVICMFHYNALDRHGALIWAGVVFLLLWVLIFGRVVSGSKRWLFFGPFSIQPSEFAKLAVILVLARHYATVADEKGLRLVDLIKPALWAGIPCALILKQPDLGTAILVCLVAGSMTLFMKIRRGTFLFLLGAGAAGIPAVWFHLKDYQRERIYTFLDPEKDPLGAGYHIIQSKIAIGSGMLYGKGYMNGSQKALSFLPEQHTDFIFSVFAEEWGLLGCAVLLLLLLLLLLGGLKVAYRSKDPFGAVLSVGVVSMIFWQAFINTGMVMGLMPVVGVPLPLVSYGGSSVLATLIGLGILLNVSMRRYLFE